MSIEVVLITFGGEKIEEVADPCDCLHYLLPESDDTSYCLVRFIDWYDDTVFNGLQMGTFIEEWDRISENAETQEEKRFMKQVRAMAQRCLQEHLYLRFIGD